MEKLYLSKREIAILLDKLDSARNGEPSSCTIIKSDNAHPVFPQTVRRLSIKATETQDGYAPGVSPRLHLSRSSLVALLDRLEKQSDESIRIDDMAIFAVPDAQYYVDRSDTEFAPVGDMSTAFSRNRGKQG